MMVRDATPRLFATSFLILVCQAGLLPQPTAAGQPPAAGRHALRAGASAIDVSPVSFPVLVNGGFLQASATKVNDPLFARCLVLDDGTTRLAIVVVDSCMMPRDLLDRAKEMAREKTGIPTESMLISATHTHSAPAAMGALGCPADPAYAELLPGRIAEASSGPTPNLVPARVGWGVDRRRQAHLLPPLDSPPGQDARRPLRPPDRAGQHAPGPCQPRRHRPVRPGRPRP